MVRVRYGKCFSATERRLVARGWFFGGDGRAKALGDSVGWHNGNGGGGFDSRGSYVAIEYLIERNKKWTKALRWLLDRLNMAYSVISYS